MSDTKFTPGPWFKCKDGGGEAVGIRIESDSQDDGMSMAVCYIESYDWPENYKANQSLIAAAPKLYAALVEAREYFEDRADAEIARPGGSFQGNEEMLLFIKIDNLLAQARGESQ
jgi:hypothetical protein